MRGRTNITPRTGPAVIGTDVTNKQVTGSTITVGDFVEFTGDTTVEHTIVNDLNYNYSKEFIISGTLWGSVFYNPTSKYLKIVVLNGDEIENQTDFYNIDLSLSVERKFGTNPVLVLNAFYDNGILFVSSGDLYDYNSPTRTDNLQNKNFIAKFSMNVDYSFNFSEYISLEPVYDFIIDNSIVPSNYSSAVIAPICKNGKIYVFIGYSYSNLSSASKTFTLLVMDVISLNVVQVFINYVGTIPFNKPSSGSYVYRGTGVAVTDNYIFIFGGDSNSYSSVYAPKGINLSNLEVVTVDSDSVSSFDNACGSANIIENNGLFFYIGERINLSGSSTSNLVCIVKVTVFHIVNGVIYSIDLKNLTFSNLSTDYHSTNNSSHFGLKVVKDGDNYHCYVNYLYGALSEITSRILYFTYNGNSGKVGENDYYFKNAQVENSVFLIDNQNVKDFMIIYFNNGTYDIVLRSFQIVDEKIVNIESFDLVKKYQSRIDGVAKTSGNVGQTITVCIP